MPRTGDTPRARALGAEIRHARDAAGLTTRELAKQLGRNNVTITRWETGHYPPSVEDTATVLGVLGVTGTERDQVIKMARDAADPNWVAPGVDRQLAALIEFERTATAITEVAPLVIPGLLQTEEYARSIMMAAGASRGEADHRVTLRMGRRSVLTRNKPVDLNVVIGEYALLHQPCERAVVADQLRHVIKWAELPNITVQMLRAGPQWSPALDGPFILIEFAKAKPIVHLEHYRSSLCLYDGKDIADYQVAAGTVRDVAVSPDDSVRLIAEIADTMETHHDGPPPSRHLA